MVLYICYHNPFGTKGGGPMASHAYLRAFAKISHGDIDLVCSGNLVNEVSKDFKYKNIYFAPERTKLEKLSSVFTGYMSRYVPIVKQILLKHPQKYNLIVFDHSNIAGPLIELANKYGAKTITIHHNYEKEYFSDNNRGLYKLLYLHHVVRWEAKAYQKSSLNLFLTKQDMEIFSKVYGNSHGKNAVIGAFEFSDYRRPIIYPRTDKQLTFAITGSLGNYQTTDAVKFFFTDLYHYLPDDCKIVIAGRNPSPKVIDLCSSHKNVVLLPNPTDMDEVVSKADVYICATRIGGGLKLRVMDGLRNGLPVITHSCSARGFDAFEGLPIFKVYNTPMEFGQKLSELLSIYNSGTFDKEKVMNIYKNNFSYDAGSSRLLSIIEAV